MIPSYVERDELDMVWPSIEMQVARALHRGTRADSVGSVYRALQEGLMGLVVFVRDGGIVGFAIAKVVEHDKVTALQVVAAGGQDYESWETEMDRILVSWAENNACDRIESFSRLGSEKILHRLGYKTLCVVMAKEI